MRFCRFGEPKSYQRRDIVSLCPLNVRVDAVFYNDHDEGEEPTLDRIPQLAIALYDDIQLQIRADEEIGRDREVGYLNSAEPGQEFADEEESEVGCDFLGYEYGGKERDWTEQIEDLKQRRALRREEALIRSVLINLKHKEAPWLLQNMRGAFKDGVLTIRGDQNHSPVDLYRNGGLEAIQQSAEHVFGMSVTIQLEPQEKGILAR